MTDNEHAPTERLWLSSERSVMGNHYALRLIGGGEQNIGTIYPLAGGGWMWTVSLQTLDGRLVTDKGQANDAEEASEQQFDALTRLEPERFMRLAA